MISLCRIGVVAVVGAGCGAASTPTSPTAAAEPLDRRLDSAHFSVQYGRAPEATAQMVSDRLEEHYARITSDLGVTVGPVTVKVWQEPAIYYDELVRYFGVRYEANGYVTGRSELRVLAVSNLPVNVVHEFAHAASLYVNPSFGNNPRWLWETVALYENGEFVDPRRIDYMVRGAYPTLQQLNADPNAGRQVYEVGYLLGEFIVTRWDRATLIRLIQTNADLQAVLGMSAARFESAWHAWLRERYPTI